MKLLQVKNITSEEYLGYLPENFGKPVKQTISHQPEDIRALTGIIFQLLTDYHKAEQNPEFWDQQNSRAARVLKHYGITV